ncbi:hypothetical protein Patl1_09401 [Pistacia atlantica]|uniref:Uncharacterized protein n=1 Tax=Pistacia atlantica TaxID=434234 RepID=A0ACC1AJW4_9ROSI|nr:hypothetical protein Patl1_09401 [Pistacia atlantica]
MEKLLNSSRLVFSPAVASFSLSSSENYTRTRAERNNKLANQLPKKGTCGSQKLLRHHILSTRIPVHRRVEHNSPISAVLTDDPSTMTSMDDDTENIGILRIDPGLEPFKDHFKYRVSKYVDQKNLFESYEGGLEEFAKGYLKFGFNREEGGIVYREWAPAAL